MSTVLIGIYIIAMLLIIYMGIPYLFAWLAYWYIFSYSRKNLNTAFKSSFKAPFQSQGTRSFLFGFQFILLALTVVAAVIHLF